MKSSVTRIKKTYGNVMNRIAYWCVTALIGVKTYRKAALALYVTGQSNVFVLLNKTDRKALSAKSIIAFWKSIVESTSV